MPKITIISMYNIFQCLTVLVNISMQQWISLIFLEVCIFVIYSKKFKQEWYFLKLDIHCILYWNTWGSWLTNSTMILKCIGKIQVIRLCSCTVCGSLMAHCYMHETDPFTSRGAFTLSTGFLGWFILGIAIVWSSLDKCRWVSPNLGLVSLLSLMDRALGKKICI